MDQLVEIIKAHTATATQWHHRGASSTRAGQVLGTPTREELMAMNPNYTESLGAWVVDGCGPKGLVETTLAGFSTLALMAYHYAYYYASINWYCTYIRWSALFSFHSNSSTLLEFPILCNFSNADHWLPAS